MALGKARQRRVDGRHRFDRCSQPVQGRTPFMETFMLKHSLRSRIRHATDACVARPRRVTALDIAPYSASGARAVGAFAVGAVALGTIAIGAMAIGRLAIGRARIRRLEIDELVVRRLHVVDELHAPTIASSATVTSGETR
jgi:hypothetical protein